MTNNEKADRLIVQQEHVTSNDFTGSSLVFSEGILHVNKDGSGYILVNESDFQIETEYDDDGSRSDFWITKFPAGEMVELKNFLNKVLTSAS